MESDETIDEQGIIIQIPWYGSLTLPVTVFENTVTMQFMEYELCSGYGRSAVVFPAQN